MPSGVQLPSVFLPDFKRIKTCSESEVLTAIARLRTIYIPQVRGSTRRRLDRSSNPLTESPPTPEYDGSKSIGDNLEILRADVFERSYSIQWLTRFISIYSELDVEAHNRAHANALEAAASLLSACSGSAASGNITRKFVFPLPHHGSGSNFASHDNALPQSASDRETNPLTTQALNKLEADDKMHEIHVILRDAPLESSDFSSVGAQTWGGSCILAEMIVENPEKFGIIGDLKPPTSHSKRTRRPFRALELGAGTGLAGLVLGKILEKRLPCSTDYHEPDTIVTTDFHPSVLANLKANVEANYLAYPAHTSSPEQKNYHQAEMDESLLGARSASRTSRPRVVVLPLDWSSIHALTYSKSHSFHSPDMAMHPPNPVADGRVRDRDIHSVATGLSPPLDTPFDLIIGADIIYEHLHARWVRSCVEMFLRKPFPPSAHPTVACTHAEHKPSASPTHSHPRPSALFHLIIPLRRTHASESRSVEEVFAPAADVLSARTLPKRREDALSIASAYAVTHSFPDESPLSGVPPESHLPELAIIVQEDIACDAYSDREEAEEVVYRYYQIGWV